VAAVARLALIVVLGCAACGGGPARAPSSSQRVAKVRLPAPIALPALPGKGLAVTVAGGVILTDARGHRVVRLRGWRLDGSGGGTSPFRLMLRHHGRTYALDQARHRLVALAPGSDAGLARGYRLIYHHHRRWSVLTADGHAVWQATGDATVSGDGALVTIGREARDLADGARVPMPAHCAAGARDGPRWYLVCARGASGPWLSLLEGGSVHVLAPRLGHGLRDGWDGFYIRAMLSPDRERLLLQYSGECEEPIAFVVSARGGRPRPVTGGDWRTAPETVALGWMRTGAALVQQLQPACGPSRQPGLYAFGQGRPRRLGGPDAVIWGDW
jgi:hypothetical protein